MMAANLLPRCRHCQRDFHKWQTQLNSSMKRRSGANPGRGITAVTSYSYSIEIIETRY